MAYLIRWKTGNDLLTYDEFAGAGGSSQGADNVPGVRLIFVANHDDIAIASHAANFPDVEHYKGNVVEADITRFPYAHIFWASPACPPWTDARGVKRDFDKTNQQVLFGPDGPEENVARARALMEEIPRYLRHWADKGQPVLGGVVENVIQLLKWDQFGRWRREIEAIGPYDVYVIAYNSMHARPIRTRRAPQSRDRAFIMYVHKAFGRRPDLRKWLSPRAYCLACDEIVSAIQVFKRPGTIMGRYWQQYVPPLMVPVEGRPGKMAAPASVPLRTQTARNETGVALPRMTPVDPFLVPLRGGGDKENARPIHDPLTTVTASGNHHGLVSEHLLVPYSGNGTARSADEPIGTLPTRDRYALAEGTAEVHLDDVLFRMLEPHEIGAAMAFAPDYIVLGNKRQRVRQYGNAVTPPVAEVLVSALVEAITGEDLEVAT